MDGDGAELTDRVGEGTTSAGSPPVPAADEADGTAAQGTPLLALDGFDGPLARLLTLARAQQIDFARISLTALLEQLEAALRQAPATLPLGQKADWLVMAAWLLQLCSQLLLPPDAPAQQHAAAETRELRERLAALRQVQALALWLERRPRLGHVVFARGQPPSRAQSPERFAHSVEVAPAIDVIEFLWASLARFDDDTDAPDTALVCRPVPRDLHTVAEARDRILRLLGESPDGAPFERLLPAPSEAADGGFRQALRRRSGWSSTLMASLELARQGVVATRQEADFQAIQIAMA